ncbi:MAG: hypothetical protein DKM50_02585 [Candidatus Margulisiibacteriota bacterium]|nr:MAG: hypothetical protein A2X43_03640 [Candidatus Margulisbacteria bacterium GWD2_39_127]OGI02494.1 MAG: hypothetical protein A2X42_07405 [Candidatus Margulisbacteria bacterium GWF2_38_17]OGI10987.1 MAG: hypothetical protein A2X41_01930 [Candidatus Margulisbacteria bacterium GWE2_39_32]PZM83181.1 MAG: hypothetical protein DKM50_02585 [Candidatus Margulisiibacteriota bacterium]HAR62516.1 hypothetical protein [Candidatus Margulisiibacteriota bacterium]
MFAPAMYFHLVKESEQRIMDSVNYSETVTELQSVLGENFVSFISYGANSLAHTIKKTDADNVLVVVSNIDSHILLEFKKLYKKMVKRLNVEPLFLTKDTILTSADIFPIEFLSIKDDYTVHFGKDIFQEFNIEFKNLRLQCELNIKGKLIVLRQAYLNGASEESLIKESFSLFLNTFNNIYRLKESRLPSNVDELFIGLERILKLDCSVFRELFRQISTKKLNRKELPSLFSSYLEQLTKLTQIVDVLVL